MSVANGWMKNLIGPEGPPMYSQAAELTPRVIKLFRAPGCRLTQRPDDKKTFNWGLHVDLYSYCTTNLNPFP